MISFEPFMLESRKNIFLYANYVPLNTFLSVNETSKSCEIRRANTRYHWTQLLSQVSSLAFLVVNKPYFTKRDQFRLSEYVNKGSLYDILKDEITMPSISLQMKLCFIKGLGSPNEYTRRKRQQID